MKGNTRSFHFIHEKQNQRMCEGGRVGGKMNKGKQKPEQRIEMINRAGPLGEIGAWPQALNQKKTAG